jgi:hypothetical protein
MRKLGGLKLSLITTGLACAITFGLHSYYQRRYFAVVPIMNNPNATLTPIQEHDGIYCGDWANDWFFLSLAFGVGALILGTILAWKQLRPTTGSVRGFDVIQ